MKNPINAMVLILLIVLAACEGNTGNTSAIVATIASETPDAQPAARITPTTTPGLATDASASTAATYAGLPTATAERMISANPAEGNTLAIQKGCSTCHSLEKDIKMVGPSWYNIGNIAAERVAGENAALYLYNSIIHPNQYVVETFLPGLMPQTYAEQLSEEELANLLAYLLTLKAE